MPLHELCLFKLGIHLGEIWYLSALPDWLHTHGLSRFLLTAPPLHLPDVGGSPADAFSTISASPVIPCSVPSLAPPSPARQTCMEGTGLSVRIYLVGPRIIHKKNN